MKSHSCPFQIESVCAKPRTVGAAVVRESSESSLRKGVLGRGFASPVTNPSGQGKQSLKCSECCEGKSDRQAELPFLSLAL